MPYPMFFRFLILVAVLGCIACDTDGTGENGETSDRDSYPESPYGVEEGDVIDDLAFTESDGAEFKFGQIFADEGNELLLLSTSAGWCTACREEQGSLQDLQNEHGDAGLYVIVTLFEDNNTFVVTDEFVQGWIEEYSLTIKVVGDKPFVMKDYYDPSLTPMNMMVDINTMEILRVTTGWDPTSIEAIIQSRLY